MIANRELLESLRERIRRIETSGRPNGHSVSLGCAALDALLPQRGIARGTIHEWLAPRGGNGAEILSLLAAREACRSGGALVVIDSAGCFYPPAAAQWGIHLENTIVVRPASPRDAAWAIDQALGCSSVAAVWGSLDSIGERWLRRFQLSAEQSGCLGLFVRPASAARQPTWSESQWRCRGLARAPAGEPAWLLRQRLKPTLNSRSPTLDSRPSTLDPRPSTLGEDRLIQVRLERLRGGAAGASLTLRIDFQTGNVQTARRDDETNRLRLSRRLAHPAVGRRAARA